jgi:hypothetical protein
MGIVIFMIGSASGKLDGLFSFGKVSEEVIVKELTSIITIEAKDGKRENFFDIFDLFQDCCFTLSPDGALFSPAGGNIDEVNGIDIHSGGRIAAMSDRIGFEKAWA